jgi:hypothetical protein
MSTEKESVETLLKELPENATLEDIQYHLYVLEKVRRGLRVADEEGTLTQDEAKARLERWTSK